MKLYGSTSSLYVRRVRVFAEELGEPIDWVDTNPTDRASSLGALRARWRDHPSLAATRPAD